MHVANTKHTGIGYIDAVVGVALMTLVFLGIFGIIQLSINLIGINKASAGAVALANEQVEFLRSLPYDDVAVLGGIPAGFITAEETIFINNIAYVRYTDVRYVDDTHDGAGAGDTNGVITDYKSVKVEVTWTIKEETKSVSLVTNIVPKGVESALPGTGVLTINVRDALGAIVPDADVRVVNTALTPTIDTMTTTNGSGTALFVGAPTSTAAYEIVVTKDGYSSAQTYSATPANPNPNPGHLTVAEDTVTTATFIIDALARLEIQTYTATATDMFTDTFADATLLATMSNTDVALDALRLADLGGGLYALNGTARSIFVTPSGLVSWGVVTWTDTATPGFTSARVQVYYDNGGTPTLVPDGDIPGNAAGFAAGPIDLSGVDPAIYPSLALGAVLSTNDQTLTPTITEWTIGYVWGPVPLPDIDFAMHGAKTIGTDGGGAPIYKYDDTHTTGSTGTITFADIEWDAYVITLDPSHDLDITAFCPENPVSADPNETTIVDIVTATDTLHTLLVAVVDELGGPIDDATVELERGVVTHNKTTAGCGQVFFGNMSQGTVSGGNPYTITITASGFNIFTGDVDVIDAAVATIALTES